MFRLSNSDDETSGVTVRPVMGLRDKHRFIRFPRELYADDPHYRPKLDVMVWEDITPGRNTWFEHGEAQLFLAERDGEVVGRISAQVDQEHLRCHDDGAGFFGFFEVEDDPEAAEQLLNVAEDWCRRRGMERIRGPFSFSINEEAGLLVEGFDYPNYVMMPHGRPYYQEFVEQHGFEKAKDLYAWRFEREQLPERVKFIAEGGPEEGVEIRNIDLDNIHRDVQTIIDIFNDAWSDNWGYVPLTEAEVAQIAEEFKLVADEDLCMIAEHEGEPVGMALALPNINEAMRDLDGKLFPTGWAKMLYRLKVDPVKSFRLILLGIKEDFRGTALGALSVQLYAEIHDRAYAAGYQEAEASWTLEDNDAINDGMEFMGAEQYKTYRVYEKEL
jgi:GNAT superfamily N-acetyltransferase